MAILDNAIGWLAPAQCVVCGEEGASLCLACSTSEIVAYGEHCWQCNQRSPGGRTCLNCRQNSPRFLWISTHYEGVAKKLLGVYKFKHRRSAANDIASLMHETLLDFNNQDDIVRTNYLIVPVPTATTRIRQRSFDHCALLAKTLSKKLNLDYAKVLGRLGQSRQLGSKRVIRLKQVEGKFYILRPELIKNRNILLIDDVLTTGATIKAVIKEMRRAGARRIDGLVFAKRL